ncbi:MAG: hypothetical protein HYZ53_29975 [Planctomycetes bacterium]|nr:hypothetical protein [Planctomycetota bacterium]
MAALTGGSGVTKPDRARSAWRFALAAALLAIPLGMVGVAVRREAMRGRDPAPVATRPPGAGEAAPADAPWLAAADAERALRAVNAGHLAAALPDWDRAIARLPASAGMRHRRAEALLAVGRWAEAEADVNVALAVYEWQRALLCAATDAPPATSAIGAWEAGALAARAAARLELKDPQGSLADAQAAAALDPGAGRHRVAEARAQEALGELPGAATAIEAALRLDAEEPDAYRIRARLRKARGDPAGARSDLVTWLRLAGDGDPATAAAVRDELRALDKPSGDGR